MTSWIVVPCTGSRSEELSNLLESIDHPIDQTVIVTTTVDSYVNLKLPHVLTVPWAGIHISRWLNVGLDYVASRAPKVPYEVLVTASDVIGTPQSVRKLSEQLRRLNVTMIGPDFTGRVNGYTIFYSNSPRNVWDRVTGTCFMMTGESNFRFDERFRWWYADDDLEMRTRHAQGAALVSGSGFSVTRPDTSLNTEKLRRYATEDRELYKTKWGCEPW